MDVGYDDELLDYDEDDDHTSQLAGGKIINEDELLQEEDESFGHNNDILELLAEDGEVDNDPSREDKNDDVNSAIAGTSTVENDDAPKAATKPSENVASRTQIGYKSNGTKKKFKSNTPARERGYTTQKRTNRNYSNNYFQRNQYSGRNLPQSNYQRRMGPPIHMNDHQPSPAPLLETMIQPPNQNPNMMPSATAILHNLQSTIQTLSTDLSSNNLASSLTAFENPNNFLINRAISAPLENYNGMGNFAISELDRNSQNMLANNIMGIFKGPNGLNNLGFSSENNVSLLNFKGENNYSNANDNIFQRKTNNFGNPNFNREDFRFQNSSYRDNNRDISQRFGSAQNFPESRFHADNKFNSSYGNTSYNRENSFTGSNFNRENFETSSNFSAVQREVNFVKSYDYSRPSLFDNPKFQAGLLSAKTGVPLSRGQMSTVSDNKLRPFNGINSNRSYSSGSYSQGTYNQNRTNYYNSHNGSNDHKKFTSANRKFQRNFSGSSKAEESNDGEISTENVGTEYKDDGYQNNTSCEEHNEPVDSLMDTSSNVAGASVEQSAADVTEEYEEKPECHELPESDSVVSGSQEVILKSDSEAFEDADQADKESGSENEGRSSLNGKLIIKSARNLSWAEQRQARLKRFQAEQAQTQQAKQPQPPILPPPALKVEQETEPGDDYLFSEEYKKRIEEQKKKREEVLKRKEQNRLKVNESALNSSDEERDKKLSRKQFLLLKKNPFDTDYIPLEEKPDIEALNKELITTPILPDVSLVKSPEGSPPQTNGTNQVQFFRTVSKKLDEIIVSKTKVNVTPDLISPVISPKISPRISPKLRRISLPEILREPIERTITNEYYCPPVGPQRHHSYTGESHLTGCIVKVCNLPPQITEEEIIHMCESIGATVEIKVTSNENSAAIRFAEASSAETFRNYYNGRQLDSFWLQVLVI